MGASAALKARQANIDPRAPDFLSSHPATPERISNATANARQFTGPGSGDLFRTPNGELMMMFGAYQQPNVGYPASRLLHVARVNLTPSSVSFSPR